MAIWGRVGRGYGVYGKDAFKAVVRGVGGFVMATTDSLGHSLLEDSSGNKQTPPEVEISEYMQMSEMAKQHATYRFTMFGFFGLGPNFAHLDELDGGTIKKRST